MKYYKGYPVDAVVEGNNKNFFQNKDASGSRSEIPGKF